MTAAKNDPAETPETFDSLALSNVNSLWGAVTAEVLYRLGMRHAVISPGSRSTPLTFAFSRHPGLKTIPVLDERSASFFALGLAKQTHQPVAVVCTSGTAAANYYPAVVEARMSRAPLIILTADRPPELRECHSGQTIDQLKLYGTYPRWQVELSLPSAQAERLRYLRQTLIHAFERAQYPVPCPVHLNMPFRDPLAPTAGEKLSEAQTGNLDQLISSVSPPPEVRLRFHGVERYEKLFSSHTQGLIVAGPVQPDNPARYTEAVGNLAAATGWPVFSDALSPLRNHAVSGMHLISSYDILLRSRKLAAQLRPDAVVSIGPLPTSKVLRAWLERLRVETLVIDPGPENVDALHRDAVHCRAGIEEFVENLAAARSKPTEYALQWSEAEKAAGRLLDDELKNCAFNFEGKISWLLSQSLPKNTSLFIANSMPVRDAEYFWRPNNRALQPYFNRGANGIDGTLSTALGVAHGGRSAVMLTGDLAFLHDINGLLIKDQFKGHLTIILINNNGGGIFEALPISGFEPPFEEYFATPQNVDFGKQAAAYGLDYKLVDNMEDLSGLLKKLPKSGIRILEIRTDRKKDMPWRRGLFRKIADNIELQ